MHRGMKKPRSLTVRHYVVRLIDLDEYLASFMGATMTDMIGVTKLKKILLNSMSNIWSQHAYVQALIMSLLLLKILFICLSVWKSLSLFTKL